MAECLSFSVERILSRTTNVAGSSSTNNLDRQFSQTQRLNFSGFTYDSNEGSSTNPIPSAPDDQAVGAGCLKLSVSDKLVGHQQDRVKQHLPTPPCSPLSVASEPDPLNSGKHRLVCALPVIWECPVLFIAQHTDHLP